MIEISLKETTMDRQSTMESPKDDDFDLFEVETIEKV